MILPIIIFQNTRDLLSIYLGQWLRISDMHTPNGNNILRQWLWQIEYWCCTNKCNCRFFLQFYHRRQICSKFRFEYLIQCRNEHIPPVAISMVCTTRGKISDFTWIFDLDVNLRNPKVAGNYDSPRLGNGWDGNSAQKHRQTASKWLPLLNKWAYHLHYFNCMNKEIVEPLEEVHVVMIRNSIMRNVRRVMMTTDKCIQVRRLAEGSNSKQRWIVEFMQKA